MNRPGLAGRLGRWAMLTALFGALTVLLSGRPGPRVWVWLGATATMLLVAVFVVPPDTMRERLKRGQPTADPVILAAIRVFAAGSLVMSLLDVGRLHQSDSVPAWLSGLGVGVMMLAFGFILWAIRVNRFFVPVVRIQKERGHHLVDSGPYRFVRHPGYVGMMVYAPTSGLALGSWMGALLGLGASVAFLLRAAGEDRFLRANLEGYADYATRVRSRLLPGVW